MPSKTIRVYPSQYGWAVKRDGSSRPRYFDYKREAYIHARKSALANNLTIVVHGSDGRIQKVVKPNEHYEREDSSGCFITTACVRYFGLSDSCYQLETLRKFRDYYLIKRAGDRLLVEQYYAVAPRLVKLISKDIEKDRLYNRIFENVNSACKAIENKQFEEAKSIYRSIVSELITRFG